MSLDHDAIRARADAATVGPWEAGTLGRHAADVFTAESDDDLGRLVICEHAGTDAEFIAHARTDIPALLDENARLRAALDAAKGCGSVITEEAVEAAVKAWDHYWGDRYGDEALEEMGDEVRVALEAAAPFLTQEAAE